VIVVASVVY